ncbi:hypothetical protein KJ682_11535 [bacterium]|nr:hypothetical protein [bacterium]
MAVFVASLAVFAAPAHADQIYLVGGGMIEGTVTKIDVESVFYMVGEEIATVARSSIDVILMDSGEIIDLGGQSAKEMGSRLSLNSGNTRVRFGGKQYISLEPVVLDHASGFKYEVTHNLILQLDKQQVFDPGGIEEYADYGGYNGPRLMEACLHPGPEAVLMFLGWSANIQGQEGRYARLDHECIEYRILSAEGQEILSGVGNAIFLKEGKPGNRVIISIPGAKADYVEFQDVLINLVIEEDGSARFLTMDAGSCISP